MMPVDRPYAHRSSPCLRGENEIRMKMPQCKDVPPGGGYVQTTCLIFYAQSLPRRSRARDVIMPNSPSAQFSIVFVRNSSRGNKLMRQEPEGPPNGEPPPWGSWRLRIRDDLNDFLTNRERPIS